MCNSHNDGIFLYVIGDVLNVCNDNDGSGDGDSQGVVNMDPD